MTWGQIFYKYIRYPLRQYVADIIMNPRSRMRATKYINLYSYLFFFLAILLTTLREYLRNEDEHKKFIEVVSKNCPHLYSMEEASLEDCMMILLPVIILNLYNFANLGYEYEHLPEKHRLYNELPQSKRALRNVACFGVLLFLWLGDYLIDYVVIVNTEGNLFNTHNLMINLIFLIFYGTFLAILFPYLMY